MSDHTEPRWDLLPDHLWLLVFGRLELSERHRGPALVCRSWAQLVCAPQLLSSGTLCFEGSGRRLRSFLAWVAQRAAGHARRLELTISDAEAEVDDADENQAEAAASAAACAVACCAAGGLQELRLTAHVAWLQLGGWAAALRGVRRLHVWAQEHNLDLQAPLAGLTTLQQLDLSGAPLCIMPEAACLPTSLTKLRLSTCASEQPPLDLAPISRLRNLYHLYIDGAETPSDGYGALLALSSMRELVLSSCDHLPACLPQLSQLQSLHVRDTPCEYDVEPEDLAASAAQLNAALGQLTQLTRLFLQHLEYCWQLPPTLADLEELECFSWSCWKLRQPALPDGPWLAGLRQLSLPVECLMASPSQLPRLRRLEELELFCGVSNRHNPPPWQPSEAELAAVRWVGQHSRLRRLCIAMSASMGEEAWRQLQAALAEAQAANPSLAVVDEGLYVQVVLPNITSG